LYPGYSADFFDDKHFVVVRSPRFSSPVIPLFSFPPFFSSSQPLFFWTRRLRRARERDLWSIGADQADDQIGGSYATIPSIASRKAFRNWYQANYPYSFIGGRVVFDTQA
jgi:hypothetical protein